MASDNDSSVYRQLNVFDLLDNSRPSNEQSEDPEINSLESEGKIPIMDLVDNDGDNFDQELNSGESKVP